MSGEIKVPLHRLGHDVLIDAVFPYLDEADIKNLSLTNKQLHDYTRDPSVWHDLYHKTFGLQPNPFTIYKWPEMYRWRRRAGLYTWGLRTGGRLGYVGNTVEEEYDTQGDGRGFRVDAGVCFPRKVDALGDTVVSDVVAGGYSFTVLTAEGRLYGVGDIREYASVGRPADGQAHPGVVAMPFVRGLGGLQGRIRIGGVLHNMNRVEAPDDADDPNPQEDAPQVDDSVVPPKTPIGSMDLPMGTRDRARPKELHTIEKTRFVSVSSGRQQLLALDQDNRVWVWDWSFVYPGTQLHISDNTVHKLVAGWNFSCAWVEDEGLLVWYNIGELQHTSYHNKDAVSLTDKVVHVPGTSNVKIMDIMCGDSFLVYVTEDGQLYRVDTKDAETVANGSPIRMDGFEKKLGQEAQFVKLTGSFTKFAVFSDKDDVFIGTKDHYLEPIVLPELQNTGCISIAIGDHHNLALLRGGKLLTWGCESKNCGAFGLGRDDRVLQLQYSEQKQAGLVLDRPTPVSVNGNVLAIAAAGWQSCAIITPANTEA